MDTFAIRLASSCITRKGAASSSPSLVCFSLYKSRLEKVGLDFLTKNSYLFIKNETAEEGRTIFRSKRVERSIEDELRQ